MTEAQEFLQAIIDEASDRFGPPVVIRAVISYLENAVVAPECQAMTNRMVAAMSRCLVEIDAALDDATDASESVGPGT